MLGQFSLRINPKTSLTFAADLITYGAGLIVEAKITNQLEPGLKRPIKLTKENFAESSSTVLNTFGKVYVNEAFQSITRKSLFLRNYFLTLQNFIFFFLPTFLIETVSHKLTNMKKKKKKEK